MTEILCSAVFLITGIIGYRVMDQLDHYLSIYVKGEEDADGSESAE